MNSNNPRHALSVLLIAVACAAAGVLFFAPWMVKGTDLRPWFWGGLQMWEFHWLYRALAVTAPIIIFLLSEQAFADLWKALQSAAASIRARLDSPWLMLAGLALFLWLFRNVSTPFGDSMFYTMDLIPREAFSVRGTIVRYDSVGTTWLYSMGFRYASLWFAMDVMTWYNFAGVASVLIFAAWMWKQHPLQPFLFGAVPLLILFLGNWTQATFGSAEHYVQVWLCAAAFAILGIECLRGRVPTWMPCAAIAIGAFFHLVIGWLFPALIYLLAARWKHDSHAARQAALLALFIPAALTGCLLYTVGFDLSFWGESNAAEGKIIPFLSARHAYTGADYHYSTFDPRHLSDIGNELLLMAWPGWLALLGTLPLMAAGCWRRAELRFALFFLLGTLAFILLWNPDLGFWRDQDLFSLAGLGVCLVAAVCWTLAREAGTHTEMLRRVALAAIVGGLLWRAPVILYHSVLDANYPEPSLLRAEYPFDRFEPKGKSRDSQRRHFNIEDLTEEARQ